MNNRQFFCFFNSSERYRHGIRIGNNFFHVMASTNGEVKITDPRTMEVKNIQVKKSEFSKYQAGNLQSVADFVKKYIESSSSKEEYPVHAITFTIPTYGEGITRSADAVVMVHYHRPTTVIFDRKNSRVFISDTAPDRRDLMKDPQNAINAVWSSHFTPNNNTIKIDQMTSPENIVSKIDELQSALLHRQSQNHTDPTVLSYSFATEHSHVKGQVTERLNSKHRSIAWT